MQQLIGLTMITDPDARQDPWRESIAQALEIFDRVVVVCGADTDAIRVINQFPGRDIACPLLHWPQPEWSYEELPRHLNAGLAVARCYEPDWIVKFDIDCFFHEKDRDHIRTKLQELTSRRVALGTFEKYQFFMVDRAYEKGKIPLAINCAFPIQYGQFENDYSDLCQPMMPTGRTRKMPGGTYDIPLGRKIPGAASTGVHVWNYDYSFKTLERATELLYHFDRSHAKWWGGGYGGKKIEDITPETALAEYLDLVRGRVGKCNKRFKPEDHPRHIRERVRNITPTEFGSRLWDKIPITL